MHALRVDEMQRGSTGWFLSGVRRQLNHQRNSMLSLDKPEIKSANVDLI